MGPIATVRNATQTAKEFASKPEGQLARIEALVTACCILVGILVLSNSRRRHESRSIPRLIIWAAFMFNYPVISYTVGLMQSSSIKNELFVVWACFLLLLLGSADTMTAFNFNDSSQQTRSMMNQGLHVIYLLLLILYYKGQLRHSFIISLFLLWALSVVRLGLRAWAYRSTCRSRGLVRENQIVYEYMKYEPLHSDGAAGGTYDPKTMKGYIYLVDGKEEERVKYGEEVIEVAYRMPLKGQGPNYVPPPFTVPEETVDVDRVWQCKGKLLRIGDDEGSNKDGSSNQGASRRRDLCLSFALFRLLRLRFAADHIGEINLPFQRDKCRDFVINGLLSDERDLDRAFRIVETELAFLFDFFYARYPSIKDTLAPDLIVYAAILGTSLFTLFSPDLMRYQPAEGGANILIGGFNFDLLVTRLVILWYIFIESYQFVAYFIFSDWHKVKMLCRYVRNESWHNRWLVEMPLKILCHFTFTKYWKGTIGQYFILDNTHPHWFKSFLSWISLKSMDSFLMTKSITLDDEVRHAVLVQLKRCKGKITDGRMSLRMIGVYDNDVLLGHTYARYILTWHVATSICSYSLDMENASDEVKRNHRIATKLSGYCMYLLAFQPDLIPDSTYTSLSMARGTLQNARDYLAECKSNEAKFEKLFNLGWRRETDHSVRFLSEGARIAIDLVDKHRFRNDEKRWKVLGRFWANMVLYIAPSDRAVAHATKMATGGEFLTIIWALLNHAHIVDKFQKIGGASGLHILLEQKEEEARKRRHQRNQTSQSQPCDDFDYDGPALFDSDDEYSSVPGSLEYC